MDHHDVWVADSGGPKVKGQFWGCPAHRKSLWVIAAVYVAKINNSISATAAAVAMLPTSWCNILSHYEKSDPTFDAASRQNSLKTCLYFTPVLHINMDMRFLQTIQYFANNILISLSYFNSWLFHTLLYRQHVTCQLLWRISTNSKSMTYYYLSIWKSPSHCWSCRSKHLEIHWTPTDLEMLAHL